ncbi:hypothetical protein SRHO_G00186440 [Serrasalmus rhombeus]
MSCLVVFSRQLLTAVATVTIARCFLLRQTPHMRTSSSRRRARRPWTPPTRPSVAASHPDREFSVDSDLLANYSAGGRDLSESRWIKNNNTAAGPLERSPAVTEPQRAQLRRVSAVLCGCRAPRRARALFKQNTITNRRKYLLRKYSARPRPGYKWATNLGRLAQSAARGATCVSGTARMAASVIRTLSGFGLTRPVQTCFLPTEEEEVEDEYEEELREEVEDSFEEEDSPSIEPQEEEPWAENPSTGHTDMTDRLLRVCPEVSGRQRYYADFMRVASSEQGGEPEKLGPLAELFKEAHRKRQGLPMTQRRLPSSFWTEPHPCHLANMPDMLSCPMETTLRSTNTPVSTLSTSNTPVSTISSSSTPDFSDLLAHWATDRDNGSDFGCDYQLP